MVKGSYLLWLCQCPSSMATNFPCPPSEAPPPLLQSVVTPAAAAAGILGGMLDVSSLQPSSLDLGFTVLVVEENFASRPEPSIPTCSQNRKLRVSNDRQWIHERKLIAYAINQKGSYFFPNFYLNSSLCMFEYRYYHCLVAGRRSF